MGLLYLAISGNGYGGRKSSPMWWAFCVSSLLLISRTQFHTSMIPNFVKAFFDKREGLKKYKEQLSTYIADQKLSEQEKKELNKIVTDYKLQNKDIVEAKKKAFNLAYKKLTSDERLPSDRVDSIAELLNYLDLKIEDTGIDTNLFRKYTTLAVIDSGKLPDVTEADHDLNIIYKDGEILHYRAYSLLRKLKHVTKSIQYHGLTASVKIVKGFRYRVGDIKVNRTTTEVLAVEDRGMFYITSQRIGYHGQQKQFAIPHDKISSLELRSDGLYLFKTGKESPYIVTLDDYEVPLAITSFIMNKDEKEPESSGVGFSLRTPIIDKYLKENEGK